MTRPRIARGIVAVAAAASVAMAIAGGAQGGEPRTRPLSVKLHTHAIEGPGGSCSAGAAWEWKEVKGATTYTIVYIDNDDGNERTITVPPYPAVDPALPPPPGTIRYGLTGLNGSGPGGCDPAHEAGYRNRFKFVRATVVIDPKEAIINGTVTRNSGAPMKRVPVEAAGSGRNVFRATTDRAGNYTIKIPKRGLGTYTVSPVTPGGRFDPSFPVLPIRSGTTTTQNFSLQSPVKPPDGAVGTIIEIKDTSGQPPQVFITRGGVTGPIELGTVVQPGDRVTTGPTTSTAFELDLGGRVTVKPNSDIDVVDGRSVADPDKIKVTKGGVWAKCGQMREPLEIQTTGGVIGVKG